ncbi:MAG: hypothetical protein ACRCTJ_00350, partial [Brevinema sp.]
MRFLMLLTLLIPLLNFSVDLDTANEEIEYDFHEKIMENMGDDCHSEMMYEMGKRGRKHHRKYEKGKKHRGLSEEFIFDFEKEKELSRQKERELSKKYMDEKRVLNQEIRTHEEALKSLLSKKDKALSPEITEALKKLHKLNKQKNELKKELHLTMMKEINLYY